MTEQFANNAKSTLASSAAPGDTTIQVVSAATFPTSGNFRLLVESEYMIVTAVSGTTFTVTRGAEGSAAAAHASGVDVKHILTAGALSGLGGGSAPTGTGLPHIVAGLQQAAASLVVNADVDAAAAIAGTKVAPDFGTQTIKTTGNVRLANGATVYFRNAANTADIELGTLDGSNNLLLGDQTSVVAARLWASSSAGFQVNSGPYLILDASGALVLNGGSAGCSMHVDASGYFRFGDTTPPAGGYVFQGGSVWGWYSGLSVYRIYVSDSIINFGVPEVVSTNDAKGTEHDVLPTSVSTTDATPTAIGSTVTLAASTAAVFTALVTAIKSDGSQAGAWQVQAAFRCDSGGVIHQLGTTTVSVVGTLDDATWGGPSITTTGATFTLKVTGKAATSITWAVICTRLEVIP